MAVVGHDAGELVWRTAPFSGGLEVIDQNHPFILFGEVQRMQCRHVARVWHAYIVST